MYLSFAKEAPFVQGGGWILTYLSFLVALSKSSPEVGRHPRTDNLEAECERNVRKGEKTYHCMVEERLRRVKRLPVGPAQSFS